MKTINELNLAKEIYKVSYLTGTFKLRSGQISNEYFDKYQFECRPLLLEEICSNIVDDIFPHLEFEVLAGLETGGIPLATVLSLMDMTTPCVFVRKAAKDYGTCKFAEGFQIDKRKCLVIEDVVTTGGQIIKSVQDLRKEGAIITDVICVIDREQGGRENLHKEGLELHPLFTMSEIKELAGVSK